MTGPVKRDPSLTFREFERGILTENGIALNPTAAFVFKCCDGCQDVDAIVSLYRTRFGVTPQVAADDVRMVLGELSAVGILVDVIA